MKDKTIVAGLYNSKKVVFYDYSFKKLTENNNNKRLYYLLIVL